MLDGHVTATAPKELCISFTLRCRTLNTADVCAGLPIPCCSAEERDDPGLGWCPIHGMTGDGVNLAVGAIDGESGLEKCTLVGTDVCQTELTTRGDEGR